MIIIILQSPAQTHSSVKQRFVTDDPLLQVYLISEAVISHSQEEPEKTRVISIQMRSLSI